MNRIALLFAGQGAQYVGMGKNLAEGSALARAIAQEANSVLGYDLASICFGGPEAELVKTEHAQPGIYLVSWMAFEVLRQSMPGLRFEATAGLSLGEYAALAAAGSLTFSDGLRLVRRRGLFMQEACLEAEGGMAAILGMDESQVQAVCAETGAQIANLNCPGQIVISGRVSEVRAACDLAKALGAKRAVQLQVAGAFHSDLMASARTKLAEELTKHRISEPSVKVISNVTARPHGMPSETMKLLVDQVTSPVRWEESMRYLVNDGFTHFIELGPGTVLSGFLKRIAPGAKTLHVEDMASLESTINSLKS
jgi:[acyl-carrier-protein] S-malonyltransferase